MPLNDVLQTFDGLSLKGIRRRVLALQEELMHRSRPSNHDLFDDVLRWESRFEELLLPASSSVNVLLAFVNGYTAAGKRNKAHQLFIKFAEVSEKAKCFPLQVLGMKEAATNFSDYGDLKNSAMWYEMARDACVLHGFALVESEMRRSLGKIFIQTGRCEEAILEYRHALLVAQNVGEHDASVAEIKICGLGEEDRASLERAALRELVLTLSMSGKYIDEHLSEADEKILRVTAGEDNTAESLIWKHVLRGSLSSSRRNYENSVEAVEAALEVAKKYPSVWKDKDCKFALQIAETQGKSDRRVGDAPPLTVIVDMVMEGVPGVLQYESRLEEMLRVTIVRLHPPLLRSFAHAHLHKRNLAKAASFFERSAQVLGKLERFREQVTDMFHAGIYLTELKDAKGATRWFQRAREVGAQHGFYSAECEACVGLGLVEQMKGRRKEAEELFLHALTALDFVEDVADGYPAAARGNLERQIATFLLETDSYEAAGPLIQRLRELAEAQEAVKDRTFQEVPAISLAVHFQAKS